MPTPVQISFEANPAVWLVGPVPGSNEADWVKGAHVAVATDFGVADGSDEDHYVLTVLEAFVGAELGTPWRFLRWRELGDAPMIVRLDVETHDPSVPDALNVFDGDVHWYDRKPSVVMIDEASALRRGTRLYLDGKIVRTNVRHHRHDRATGVDIVLACVGTDLRSTAIAMSDLDALARSITVRPAEEGPR